MHTKRECRRKAPGSSGICASCVFLKILRKNNRLKPLGRGDKRGIRDVTCCGKLPLVPSIPFDGRSTTSALTQSQTTAGGYTNGDEQIDCGGVGCLEERLFLPRIIIFFSCIQNRFYTM